MQPGILVSKCGINSFGTESECSMKKSHPQQKWKLKIVVSSPCNARHLHNLIYDYDTCLYVVKVYVVCFGVKIHFLWSKIYFLVIN